VIAVGAGPFWNLQWNPNGKHQLQPCIQDRHAGGLASECPDSLVCRRSDSYCRRPIPYSVEKWSPHNKHHYNPTPETGIYTAKSILVLFLLASQEEEQPFNCIPFRRSTSNSGFS
jgi:hypothetical protein